MSPTKTLLVTIAFFALSVVMLLETPSLFVSQHIFVDLSGSQNDINCTSCHPQIADELARSQIHSSFACEECHRIKQTAYGVTITYAEADSTSWVAGKEAHAAYVPRCLDCHGGNGQYIDYLGQTKTAPVARAFNTTPIPDYVAHKNFVEWANQSGIAIGENEACLACHTNFSVQITYRYFWNMTYTKDSGWNLVFDPLTDVNGTRTYEVSLARSGGKHEWVAASFNDPNFCIRCHKNIYDSLVNGTLGTERQNLIHAPVEIDPYPHGGDGWDVDNNWGHLRYHYINGTYRSSWVNTTYCLECHNVEEYRNLNPDADLTYDLQNVSLDTNSLRVHVAEKLTCLTCHGYGKTKSAITDPYSLAMVTTSDHMNFLNQTAALPNSFAGNVCMGCHAAGNHYSAYSGGCGGWCHGNAGSSFGCNRCHGRVGYSASITFNVESEPTGNVTWN
ncbi:hypothetical protein [Geoglobus ahangari]